MEDKLHCGETLNISNCSKEISGEKGYRMSILSYPSDWDEYSERLENYFIEAT